MFDPYHKWLGIAKKHRPPTHYQLLGIDAGETDPEVIEEAAIRQTAHLRVYQMGQHAKECARLLEEIAQARRTLLDPARRLAYDAKLGGAASAAAQPAAVAGDATAGAPAPQPAARAAAPLDKSGQQHERPADRRVDFRRNNKPLIIGLAAGIPAVAIVAVVAWLLTRSPSNSPDVQGPASNPKNAAQASTPVSTASNSVHDIPELRTVRGVKSYLSRDGRQLWTLVNTNEVHTFAVDTGERLHTVRLGGGVGAVSPDGGMVVTNSRSAFVLWDRLTGAEVGRAEGTGGSMGVARFSADGRLLLGIEKQRGRAVVLVWDVQSKQRLQTFDRHTGGVNVQAASADGRVIASGGNDGVRVWELATGNELRHFADCGNGGGVIALAFTPDAEQVFCIDRTPLLRWYDLQTGQARTVKTSRPLTGAALSGDGRQVLTIDEDRVIALWDAVSGQQVARLSSPDRQAFKYVDFAAEARYAVAHMNGNARVRLWQLP